MAGAHHGDSSDEDRYPRPGEASTGRDADLWRTERAALFVGVRPICVSAARLTGVDGAAVALSAPSQGMRELVYATDPIAHQIDELQFVLGEGPCLQAYQRNRAVLCARLCDEVCTSRWPVFTAELIALGVAALFAYPILGDQHPVGVLELYRRTEGNLGVREQKFAQLCATALRDRMQSNWVRQVRRHGGEEQALGAAELSDDVSSDPFTRSQVSIAAGMVAEQLGASVQVGLDRVRAYAYAHQLSLVAVATEVIERRLSFRADSDDRSQ